MRNVYIKKDTQSGVLCADLKASCVLPPPILENHHRLILHHPLNIIFFKLQWLFHTELLSTLGRNSLSIKHNIQYAANSQRAHPQQIKIKQITELLSQVPGLFLGLRICTSFFTRYSSNSGGQFGSYSLH